MKIVRLFSFMILIGAYLSADSNSGNLPAPISIDFGVNNGMRSDITDGCDLPDSETTSYLHLTADGAVLYKSLYDIAGFQFTVDGDITLTDAYGGDSQSMPLVNYNTSTSIVLGAFLFGGDIPAGCGTLIYLDYEGVATGLSEIVVSDPGSAPIYFEYYAGGDEAVLGCTDMNACNYNADATEDDGSCLEDDCAGECGGSAVVDECGVCDGDGIADGACDCDGNIDDCTGECGGSAVVDECGVCDGNNLCISTLSILYETQNPISGFQFTIDNVFIVSAYGGVQGTTMGFQVGVSDDSTTVTGWALASNIPVGADDILVQINILGDEEAACLSSNTILIGDDDEEIENHVVNCLSIIQTVWGCMDSTACNFNEIANLDDGSCLEDDCSGECGGDAVVDACGVCGGDGSDDQGCGCFEPSPSGCDNTCGSTLENDECGVCGGDGMTECLDGLMVCDAADCEIPELFGYEQSSLQAFYYFETATINNVLLGVDDWVGAFNGDVCIGSRKWDTSECGGGICDVPAMGDNGSEYTNGYMIDGDIPSFKIYDASEDSYYDAVITEYFTDTEGNIVSGAWSNLGIYMADNLNIEPDCAGIIGGSAEEDECGVCNGYGPPEGFTCDGTPQVFTYNQSTIQAFYYFNLVTLNGVPIDDNDWVGAFNGDICVGAREWDTLLCGNGICDVPVMGDDGSEVTVGYMNTGEYPTFKIYDASENLYYDAVPTNYEPWANFALYTIPSLNGGVLGCTDSNACNFDEGATIDDDSCTFAEENFDCNGNCIAEIDCAGECGGSAIADECGICGGTGIPDGECDCEGNVEDCAGDCGGSAETDACGDCNGDGPPAGYTCEGTPELFDYNQSTLQAFYYFNSVTLNGITLENDDWVGAFNGEICVGSRKWDTSLCNSGVCDVPLMGSDDNDWTEGYMQSGYIPTFKVFDASSNEYFEALPSENIEWNINDIFVLDALQGGILGCTDNASCNFESDATVDDGTCILPDENYDCDGNCVAEFDCEGECGGSANIDECGVCNGDGADDGFNCDGEPLDFVFNQSSLQAFYYIHETSDLEGNPLTAEDWVGIFNGETCVGSRQWDSALCNSGVCDVPAMGDDGYDYSEGYLLQGDYPSFKIYDFSEGEYFDAYPSENFPFENAAIYNVNELVLDFNYSIPLHQYNNLMSFYVLPEDNSVGNVMLDIQESVIAISGEATSAQYFFEEDYWTGTLMNLDISSGYWLRVAEDDTLDGSGHNYDPNRIYNLNSGANLVSFPSTGSVGISAGLPDEIEDHVLAVLGEGMSTVNSNGVWEGSLLEFKALHGYWIITDEEFSFSYDLDSLEPLSRKVNPYLAAEVPHGFDYIQSTQQAFYYVEDIKLINGEIENGDWLFSYCGNTVTGARQWLGRTVDIPAMGAEGDIMTAGYCGTNDAPHFKLLKSNGEKLISLHAETPTWHPNGIFFLGSLQEIAPLPSEFEMHAAYPNPFNPMTQLRFEVPTEGNLEISIFDLRGQKVETLVKDFIQPGEYSTNWDASNVASGVYFVHFTASGVGRTPISQIQKLMLVK